MARKQAARRPAPPPPVDPPPPAEGDAATAQPSPPAEPVRRIRIRDEQPVRAGGHVLTERGWQPATQHEEK